MTFDSANSVIASNTFLLTYILYCVYYTTLLVSTAVHQTLSLAPHRIVAIDTASVTTTLLRCYTADSVKSQCYYYAVISSFIGIVATIVIATTIAAGSSSWKSNFLSHSG